MTARVAVIIPCYNEAITIGRVIGEFRAALPGAAIHVFDNNSTDATAEIARAAGAHVRPVGLQGKAQVMRRLFADVEAEVYVMVDGDDTYHAASASRLVAAVLEGGADMAVGVRVSSGETAYRPGHVLGNRLLTGFLSWLFGRPCRDILSGYRALSRRCVKSFPVLSTGFGIEAELTVHTLELTMPIAEVDTPYKERPEGSVSKLSTWRDGFRVLWTILRLFVAERPLAFYGIAAAALALLAGGLAAPLLPTYLETGLVPRFPTAILATGLALMAALSLTAGLVLDTVTRGRREQKLLAYLAVPGP
jgi:glycosyltransferase involved in cell wall biosynthesis